MENQTDSILKKMSHGQAVEIHLNEDTRETRHCFVDFTFRIHEGFTLEDVESGWRQVQAFYVNQNTDAEVIRRIEKLKQEAVTELESYWNDLADADDVERVIHNGVHYTQHPIVKGIRFAGFGNQAFRVDWLASDREPTICNLFAQGRIPMWLRDKLPDNARSIEDIVAPTLKDHQKPRRNKATWKTRPGQRKASKK